MAHLLFLSHAGADTERALCLAAAIEASPEAQAAGLKVWLDKRPDGPHRLQAGTPWQDQLERAIATDSTAFGLLLTREGARNWVRLEVRVALDRVIAEQRAGTAYPFVPIIADDPGDLAHLPPFAQQYQGVRLTNGGSGLADLVRVAARLDAAQPVRLVDQPFMGLEAFEAKDAALFFGRREETQKLVDRLRTTNLVLVTGDSGSGKSSLVKAGLVPAFREGALADPMRPRPEPGQWHVVEMRPGTDPFEGLVEGVGKAASAAGKSLADQGTLNDWVRTRDPDKIRDALRQSGPPGASLLLVVDQFEELWTLTTDDTKRRDFLAALLALVPEGDLARRVVGTMRRDYYHLHTDDERLRDRLAAHGNAGKFVLGVMAPECLRDIVEKPLLLAGESEFGAAALADEVVKDVAGEPGNLALVEMALNESWVRRHESGGDLALAYQRLDRLEGALARAAEDVFWNPTNDPNKLTEPERPIAEALFMRLVRAGDAGSATRRPVSFIELEEPAHAVARKLATPECRRLLVLREPDGGDHGEDAITVELAHEQLVTQWPDYRFWLRGTGTNRHKPEPARAPDKRTLDRLMDAAAAWNAAGRGNDDLARGYALTEFKWLRTASFRNPWLSALEREFVDHSVAASEAAERKHQQQVETLAELTRSQAQQVETFGQLARTRRQQTWGAAVGALLLLIAASTLAWQWRVAEANKHFAEVQLREAQRIDSRRLANLSLQATQSGNAITGLLLALHALPDSTTQPIENEVWAPLRAALVQQNGLVVLRGRGGLIWGIAISPDGTKLASGTDAGVRIWPVNGDGESVDLDGYIGRINGVDFSPDGNFLIAGADDGTLLLWDVARKSQPTVLSKIESAINSIAFSPDGASVAGAIADGSVRVWRTHGASETVVMHGHTKGVTSVAFSADGIYIASGSEDGTAQVWRADGTGEPLVLDSPGNVVRAMAFSPDGTKIATAGWDNTVRVWSAKNGSLQVVLTGHEDGVTSLAFNPKGSQIASGSADRTVRIWVLDGAVDPRILRGHEDGITSVKFSPDGTRVISGSKDKTLRIWRSDGADEPVVLHQEFVNSVAFSPDGKRLVAGSQNGAVQVWPVDGRGRPTILGSHRASVTSVVWNSIGDRIASGSRDRTVSVWNPNAAEGHLTLQEASEVYSVVFSPDGTQIAAGLADGTIHMRPAAGGGGDLILRGHRDAVLSIAFSKDGTRIATGSFDRTVRVWPIYGAGEPTILIGHSGPVDSVAFSPTGEQIVSGSSDGTVRRWQASGVGESLALHVKHEFVSSVTYSPDATRIAAGTSAHEILMWRADNMGEPLVLYGHDLMVTSVAFSPDGTQLASGSWDGTIRIWPLVGTLEQTAAIARARPLPRQLSQEERKLYFISDK